MSDIGALIRRERARRGLTQAQLATRAATSQAHVSRIECGAVSPSMDTARDLLWAMGLTIEIDAGPLRGWLDDDLDQRRRLRAMSMSDRLETALALSEDVAALRAGVER